jgi:GT2 family glycosyltransferase
MSDLMRVHRLLCLPFVDEAAYRAALGGTRADLGTVGRYLALPLRRRPVLSVYFDPIYYLATNPELMQDGTDPLLHFLDVGFDEGRSPHPLIDLAWMLDVDPSILGIPRSIDKLVDALDLDLSAPGPYFDPVFYRQQLGRDAPAQGMLRSFLLKGIWAGLRPNPFIDPAWYAERNLDVPRDPYGALRHFIVGGDNDARSPGPDFDGREYWRRYPDVAAARRAPLRHYLTQGRRENRLLRDPEPEAPAATASVSAASAAGRVPAQDREALLRDDAGIRNLLAHRRQQRKESVRVAAPSLFECEDAARELASLAFSASAKPRVSILIPVYNEIAITAECLMALAASPPETPFEIVLVDDASTDPASAAFTQVDGIRLLRQARNGGFIAACNTGFEACRGDYVLLLNNDTQPEPGSIDALVAVLDGDETIGAAGAKLIYPDGRLQEAGCTLAPNGESTLVGLFANPREGGYRHDRDVAYCSGAALLVRRAAVGSRLFDPHFAPAYCEDADLCLRLMQKGLRIRYVASSVIVHRLSVSTGRGSEARRVAAIRANQQKLVERWGEVLAAQHKVRVLAFYLPQFHATPENDLWWGAGFTEWHNVGRARPSHTRHYQPHLPADLGYYDLTSPAALARQAALAAHYGIDGFVVYSYNFGERRVLTRPIETVRAHPEIPFHWCLCWANENWTRHWDGGEREILLEQHYDDATLGAIIDDAVAQAADPRYIRVDGRPMFLVYRPLLLPDAKAFAARARAAFAGAGFPGVHLVGVEGMEAVDRAIRPADYGFDATVEFPPHGRSVPARSQVEVIKPGWDGYRFDYPETVAAFIGRETVPYTRYPAVFPDWDNTPRQPLKGTDFEGATPEAFRAYVEAKLAEARALLHGEHRMLFVNAWNEWAEGAHLEPDLGYGHRWLEALRAAQDATAWQPAP